MHTSLRHAGPRARRFLAAAGLLVLPILTLYGCFGGSDDPVAPADETGAVSGFVQEPSSGAPVVGAVVTVTPVAAQKSTVSIAASSAITDASGHYTLEGVTAGTYDLSVDASGVVVDPGNTDLGFVGYTTRITVERGSTRTVDAYLPVVDRRESEPVSTGQPTVLEPSNIPGLRIEIAADAVTFPDGAHTGDLNVVQVGFDQAAVHLDAGMAPGMMIRILPEGTTFNPPATIRFPNRDNVPDSQTVELFSLDPATRTWVTEGRATSSGSAISSNPGVGIDVASTHFYVCDATTLVGRVLDTQDTPVQGAVVTAFASVDPFGEGAGFVPLASRTATTDPSGNFEITGVRACNVSFGAVVDEATAFGEVEPEQAVAATPAGITELGTKVMELVTETTFSITGVVRASDGTPMPFAHVQYFDPDTGPVLGPNTATVASADGAFVLENLVGLPGREMGLYAWIENTDTNGDMRFTVPALNETGSVLERDVRVCDRLNAVSLCGDWGTWSLSGSTLTIVSNHEQCGVTQTETAVVTIMSLSNGVLTVQFEEQGQVVTVPLTRVGESGPSSISAANLRGIYRTQSDEGVDTFIGLLSGGQFVNFETYGVGATASAGTYSATSSQLTVTFKYNTEPGSVPGETQSLNYAVSGKTMTIQSPEGDEVFGRCDQGPQADAQGMWTIEHSLTDAMSLLIYNGEFASASVLRN